MSKSLDFIKGYELAMRQWQEQGEPEPERASFDNPFVPGSDAGLGYERAVYDLTEK